MPSFGQGFHQPFGRVLRLDVDLAIRPLRLLVRIAGGILFLSPVIRNAELDELVTAGHGPAFCIFAQIPADDRLFHNVEND